MCTETERVNPCLFLHQVLPVHCYKQPWWNILNDEVVAQTLQTQLLSHTKGHYITASDVVEIYAGPAMKGAFLHSGILHTLHIAG